MRSPDQQPVNREAAPRTRTTLDLALPKEFPSVKGGDRLLDGQSRLAASNGPVVSGNGQVIEGQVLSSRSTPVNGTSERAWWDDEQTRHEELDSTRRRQEDAEEPDVFDGSGRDERSDQVNEDMSAAALYLREICRTPLLTAEQEIDYGRAKNRGIAASKELPLLTEQLLSEPHNQELLARRVQYETDVREGDSARRKLVESNLRLVVSVARKYIGRGVPFLDMVQEGNIGLDKGSQKYDYRKGFRFSTYAYWWIRQAITRDIANSSRTIRVPVHMIEEVSEVYAAMREIEQDPSREEAGDVKPFEIARLLEKPVEKIEAILKAVRVPVSLEDPFGADGESRRGDFVEDPGSSTSDDAERKVLKHHVGKLLGEILSTREAEVIRLRFGLEDGKDRTLGDIGEELGISRERVRQIEAKALGKLGRSRAINELRDYI